jgi:gamma-glutamylaminecyclotransferase
MALTFRLFVYGTLKGDGCRRHVLAGQRFVGPARTLPRYALYDLGPYPGLVADAAGQVIEGELYEVAEGARPTLDSAEGAPSLFKLEPIELDGVTGPVVAYFYQRSVKGRPRCAGVWQNVPGRDEEE